MIRRINMSIMYIYYIYIAYNTYIHFILYIPQHGAQDKSDLISKLTKL